MRSKVRSPNFGHKLSIFLDPDSDKILTLSMDMHNDLPRNFAILRSPYNMVHTLMRILYAAYDMIFEISHLQPNNHFLFSVGFQYFILLLLIWNLEVFY